ncbi:sulfurtransferase [Scopulibacillus cellulosilyticus]|uniref:Sulfurtransferase n=1 Tax=Scopulibacillus cellulosilyticus TaxID=2665665 RepID=A0ABW2PWI6_9BACL
MVEVLQSPIVSTEWVEEHKNDADVQVVEVDVDTNAYDSGHIEGAIAWNWTTQLNDQIRRDILDRGQMEQLLGRSSISPDTTIVLYGDNNNWFAAYAYWQLKLYGHENLALMDGGRVKWEMENRPYTLDVPEITPAEYQAKSADLSLRALQPDVLTAVKNSQLLVDVRSPKEYTGEIIAPSGMNETAQRSGHIPGAVNIPWNEAANEDGTFKSREELKRLYAKKGITSDKPIITYCRIGERSSHTWFVLHELLKFNHVRNYDGSWTEWGSMIGVPIDK